MPRRSHVDAEFRESVCRRIDAYIVEHDLSDVEAARVLGVRKQMIGPYRKGKALPGTEAIARACIEWKLSFSYQGIEISARTFTPQNGKPTVVAYQLELPLRSPSNFGVYHRVFETFS